MGQIQQHPPLGILSPGLLVHGTRNTNAAHETKAAKQVPNRQLSLAIVQPPDLVNIHGQSRDWTAPRS